jgi:chorismate lyase
VGAPGSLSAHLHRACPPLQVQWLRQGLLPVAPAQRRALGLPLHAPLHVREVLLLGGGQPRVFARSLAGQGASRTAWRAVRGLGSRPLAELLFTRAGISRSALVWRWLPPAHPQARDIARAWAQAAGSPWPGGGLWQRHSIFHSRGQPLWVAEHFPQALWRDGPRRVRPDGRCSRRRLG